MPSWRWVPVAGHLRALVFTLVALPIALLVEPRLHPTAFFIFFAAVTLSAWHGGLGPGLLSALLSVLALAFRFTPPSAGASVIAVGYASIVRLAMYTVVAVLASSLRDSRRTAKRQAESHAAELATVVDEAARQRAATEVFARRQEEALAVLDTMLATSPVAFGYWDSQLRCVRVNRELAKISGLPEEAHAARSLREVLPALATQLEPAFARVLEHGEPEDDVELTVPASEASSQPHTLLASLYPVQAAEGEVLGVGAAIVDITERKHLEAQLHHAQRMEAVGRLAGGIAHDFNNVLTAIKSYSQFLLEELGPQDERVNDVREISGAADRAAALTRQLLAFSRKQVLQPTILDLNEVVTDTERLLRRLIGEDIELVTRLDPELGRVEADRAQIEQVLMNLAVNARDAMPFGGVLIVETTNVDLGNEDRNRRIAVSPGPYVMLTVRDTGSGIDEATMGHIFEPFFTTKPLGHGTGLGLSTVYGIVRRSNGDICVDSVPGKGTTFEVYLPRIRSDDAAATRTARTRVCTDGRETILLVEDDDMLRPLMRRVLQGHGYTVIDARTGLDALRIVRRHEGEVHLVMTDLVMPEMGGRDLAERVQLIRPHTKVLYLSGYSDDVVLRRGLLDPHMAYLQKPFTPDELTRTVREVLEGAEERAAR
jgi:PAS domain S-box-containing protein